ncbi:MAG: NfeD family protein [Acidimicrobiales bacterium]|nr:NfeD family protein [Acidimicrobiales bacterium]
MLLLALGALLAAPAGAAPRQERDPAPRADAGYVSVIEVSGLLDRVLVDFIERQIDEAERQGAISLVLQLNSSGAVVADERLAELVDRVERSDVPVDIWVGPSGSRAAGDTTALLAAARTVGVAPSSRIEVTRVLLGKRSLRGEAAIGDDVGAEDAVRLDLADNDAPIIGQFILGLEGVESEVVTVDGERQRQPVSQARFAQLPLSGQLMHTVSSPPVAYLLFVIGLALILFELFTAGVGVAGLVGAGALVLGCYGLAALPANPVAVGLILLATVGYAIDVQTGVPRAWSVIATVAFVVGSVVLYDEVSLSWITLLVAIVGMTLAMLAGMPAMVRTRFSTPTIGREWMVGEVGTARGPVSPDGIVLVRDAPWRARTNRVTPIGAGQPVRVVSIAGLVLEVEPVAAANDAPDDPPGSTP